MTTTEADESSSRKGLSMKLLRGWRWPYLVVFIAAFLIAVVGVQLFVFPPPQGRPSIVGGLALGAIRYALVACA
jgi:hypothetical protein